MAGVNLPCVLLCLALLFIDTGVRAGVLSSLPRLHMFKPRKLLKAAGLVDEKPSKVNTTFSPEEQRLISAARQSAGILLKPPRGESPHPNTVLVTAASNAYMAFLRNWLCRAQALQLKYLVIALDLPLYQRLSEGYFAEGTRIVYPKLGEGGNLAMHFVGGPGSRITVPAQIHAWRQGAFNAISCTKVLAAGILLAAGLNVMFIDADVGMLQVPIPMIPSSDHVHYAYQANVGDPGDPSCMDGGPEEGNTGVYWARNSSQMTKWFLSTPRFCQQKPGLDDQTVFWDIFRFQQLPLGLERGRTCGKDVTQPRKPYVCPLSPCLTPNGFLQKTPAVVRVLHWLNGKPPLLVHPNYLGAGQPKVNLLKALKLWVADSSDKCSADAQQELRQAWELPA